MKNFFKVAVVSVVLVIVAVVSVQAAPVSGIPGVVKPKAAPVQNIVQVIQSAGLDALGGGGVAADPVLGEVPVIGYAFKNHIGNMINTSTNSANSDYVVSTDGFQKLYMDNSGVGRIYYRAYSAEHGWSSWCNSGETSNTNDDGARVQAIQLRHKGYIANLTDVYYKVVLNDGTVLDWASNGQTTGTMGTDRYIVALSVTLVPKGARVSVPTKNIMCANAYEGMYKDASGMAHYSTFDGRAYTGWAYESGNKQYFFINNSIAPGWQYADGYKIYFDKDGAAVTDLEPIMGLQNQYQIRYNKSTRTMYIMAYDPGTQSFNIPFKTFMTSCGPATPLGNYDTLERYDWKYMHDAEDGTGGIYCQKLTRFKGSFLMHSLLYYKEANPFTLDAINYNFIDYAASGGCIRLRACDANWIYNHIPLHTPIHIFENMWDKGPIEKDAVEQAIPRTQNYDPTDPEALAVVNQGGSLAANADAGAAAADTSGGIKSGDSALGKNTTGGAASGGNVIYGPGQMAPAQ